MKISFSIIITCFNKGTYIEETLNSVLTQNYSDYEILVIDDFSNDDSVKKISVIAENYATVKLVINNENKGANFSRNRGLDNCKYNYVIF